MSMVKETILIASDHNGNDARDFLVPKLLGWGYSVVDMGPRTDDRVLGVTKVNYTDYAEQLAYAITKNSSLRGILICGTGVGMSICANRFKGVKASLVGDVDTAKKTREHNDSNVLVMGSWNTSKPEMENITAAWLNEEFGKGRHEKRVAKLDDHTSDDVVLVPGVFELIHTGHIKLFEFAKSFGRVVVALNTTKSAEKIKKRKIKVRQEDRMNVLERLDLVDEVILMDDEDAGNLLVSTGAKYLVKGGRPDFACHVRNVDNVPDDCEIKMFPHDNSYSSSDIREAFRGEF